MSKQARNRTKLGVYEIKINRIIAIVIFFLTMSISTEVTAITRGEVMDRNAAANVASCANQYLGRPNSGANTEVWIMCLHVSSELAGRDKLNVARQVIRSKGYNVFEVENKPSLFSATPEPRDLTQGMIDRILSGE